MNYDSTDTSRKTFLLEIDTLRKCFTMTYLPDTQMPRADTFIDSQPLHANDDFNELTMVGKLGGVRIDVSQSPDKMVWKDLGSKIGHNE